MAQIVARVKRSKRQQRRTALLGEGSQGYALGVVSARMAASI